MAWKTKTTGDPFPLQPSSAFPAVVTLSEVQPSSSACSAVEVFFGSHFVWNLPLDLTTKGEPTRSLHSRRHHSQVHWNTQGSPPRQGGEPWRTFSGGGSHFTTTLPDGDDKLYFCHLGDVNPSLSASNISNLTTTLTKGM